MHPCFMKENLCVNFPVLTILSQVISGEKIGAFSPQLIRELRIFCFQETVFIDLEQKRFWNSSSNMDKSVIGPKHLIFACIAIGVEPDVNTKGMVRSLKMATTVGFRLMPFKSASALFQKMYSVIKCSSLLECHYCDAFFSTNSLFFSSNRCWPLMYHWTETRGHC